MKEGAEKILEELPKILERAVEDFESQLIAGREFISRVDSARTLYEARKSARIFEDLIIKGQILANARKDLLAFLKEYNS